MRPTRLDAAEEYPLIVIRCSRPPATSDGPSSVSQEWDGKSRVASCQISSNPAVFSFLDSIRRRTSRFCSRVLSALRTCCAFGFNAAIWAVRSSNVESAVADLSERARALVREQLAEGPKPGSQIAAAAAAAEISERWLRMSLGCGRSGGSGGCRAREQGSRRPRPEICRLLP
jgi:hypothetical protein